MNSMVLMSLTSSPQATSKSVNISNQSTGESAFSSLLGQLVNPGLNQATKHDVDNNEMLGLVVDNESTFSELLGQLGTFIFGEEFTLVEKADGGIQDLLMKLLPQVSLTEDEIEESVEIQDLLTLLPVEAQEELMDFVQMKKQDLQQVSEWPQIQQIVLVLMNTIAIKSTKLDSSANHVQSNFSTLDNGEMDLSEELVNKLKQLIDQKKAEGQSVLDIRLNRGTEKTVPHLNLPLFNETIQPQGLNLSQSGQELGQAITKAEQATIHIGDRLPKEVQQQQFLRQFQSLIQRSVLNQGPTGMNTLSIKLFPAHLGRLDIQLTQLNGVITAKILTGSATTRDLIESQISQLRQAFNQQQIQVERIEIAEQYLGQEKEEQSSNRNKRDDEQKLHDEEEPSELPFQDLLDEASFNEQI